MLTEFRRQWRMVDEQDPESITSVFGVPKKLWVRKFQLDRQFGNEEMMKCSSINRFTQAHVKTVGQYFSALPYHKFVTAMDNE